MSAGRNHWRYYRNPKIYETINQSVRISNTLLNLIKLILNSDSNSGYGMRFIASRLRTIRAWWKWPESFQVYYWFTHLQSIGVNAIHLFTLIHVQSFELGNRRTTMKTAMQEGSITITVFTYITNTADSSFGEYFHLQTVNIRYEDLRAQGLKCTDVAHLLRCI